jgi:tight adherence protein C
MTPMQLLVAFVAAGAILLIALAISGSLDRGRVRTRLNEFGSPPVQNLETLELQEPLFERTIRPIAARMAGFVSRTSSASFAERTSKRLAIAGYPANLSVPDWLTLKLIIAALTGGITALTLLILGMAPVMAILIGALAVGIGYVAPEFWLGSRGRRRQAQILRMTPDALDLLNISVKAGLGFDAALAKVVEKLDGPLSDEFRRALAEIRIGRTRRESLRDIIPRTDVKALTNFIGAIIQAEQLGVPISKVLQVQSEQLRIERRQRAETMAAKAPIKMLFPLIGCVFPSLFIVILGPAMILIINALGTT